ncbi:unnamed protein product [Malus baccata var. baccata]
MTSFEESIDTRQLGTILQGIRNFPVKIDIFPTHQTRVVLQPTSVPLSTKCPGDDTFPSKDTKDMNEGGNDDFSSDATVNKVLAMEHTASLKAGLKSMEKQKGMLGSSAANANVGRGALADVSNVKSNSSRIFGGRFLNLGHLQCRSSKSVRIKSLQRVSVGTGGKGRESFNTSEMLNQRTKAMGLNHESIVTDGRTSNTSLKLLRKSLLVLKVNPEEASIPKATVGKKVVPRVNDTTRSHLLRNRVSDIFVIMGQRNSNVRVLTRNSVRPTLSTLKARESQRTLKSKGASGPNKLVSATATSSKTEKVATSSLPENVKHEATQGELPSEANCSQSASTIISRRKSYRRRSYTSLLMTGSRLLEDRVEALKEEELPSIDDDCKQLEVSDYVDEIYQYYWVSEAQNPPAENFMSIQAGITHHMRGILVNWLIELAVPLICSSGTGTLQIRVSARNSFLMVTLLDQYLSQVTIKKDDMQLVSLHSCWRQNMRTFGIQGRKPF